jgi:hypothetical protein
MNRRVAVGGEVKAMSRSRSESESEEGVRRAIGAQSSVADPKPGELPMARAKSA